MQRLWSSNPEHLFSHSALPSQRLFAALALRQLFVFRRPLVQICGVARLLDLHGLPSCHHNRKGLGNNNNNRVPNISSILYTKHFFTVLPSRRPQNSSTTALKIDCLFFYCLISFSFFFTFYLLMPILLAMNGGGLPSRGPIHPCFLSVGFGSAKKSATFLPLRLLLGPCYTFSSSVFLSHTLWHI